MPVGEGLSLSLIDVERPFPGQGILDCMKQGKQIGLLISILTVCFPTVDAWIQPHQLFQVPAALTSLDPEAE